MCCCGIEEGVYNNRWVLFSFFEKFVSGKVDGFRVIMFFAGLQKVVLLDLRLRVEADRVYGAETK